MKLWRKISYVSTISIGMSTLIVFVYIFSIILFTPSDSVLLIEPNPYIALFELLWCITGLFGMILLCRELINNG